MTAHFPKTSSKEQGYSPAQVDELISRARQQFANPSSHSIASQTLRTAQFELVPGGYVIEAVDAALDRLDDAFAVQDAKRLVAQVGEHGAAQHVLDLQILLNGRVERPAGRKFTRNKWWLKGYSTKQVDQVLNLVRRQLAGKTSVPVDTLREVTFRPKWGGYVENQVDAFIDRTIEYIQLSSTLGA
jgi:DivIVA domain-containing protein